MKSMIIIVSFLFLSVEGNSRVLFQPFQSSRSMGMGGTSISFARGIDALYINAAALARVEGYSFTIGEASVGYGKNSQRLVDQYKSTAANLAAADLSSLYNNTFFVEASAKSGMVFPYFGVGAYSSNYMHETFLDSTIPSFNVDFVSDYGYMIAAAIPIGGNVSIGITGRYLKRWAGEKDVLVTSLIGTKDKDLIESIIPDKGTGNALDISFLATFSGPLSPSIAFVWKDLGGTKFQPYAGTGPNSQEDNLIFGASIQHPFAYGSWTHAFEYNFIRTNGEDFSKKYHIGTEASFGVIDLRAGLSQGYVTYGAGIDLSFIRADVAAYTLELGSKSGQTPSDRYQASLSLNLDFDQAFKLSKDGKKRRLMQRR